MVFDNQNNLNANLHRQLPDRYSGVFASGFTFFVVGLLQQLSRRQMYAFVSRALLERLRLKERIAHAFQPWCAPACVCCLNMVSIYTEQASQASNIWRLALTPQQRHFLNSVLVAA